MILSLTTIVVVTANLIVSIIAGALLMLVLWEAPRQRMNQFFALAMLLLGAYAAANAVGRFIDDLNLNPEHTTYVAVTLYGWFTVAIYFFGSEFAEYRNPASRAMRILGIILLLAHTYALWTDRLMINIRPAASNDGSYVSEWTWMGLVAMVSLLVYLVVTAVMLRQMPDPRGQSLWLAPIIVIVAIVSSVVIWPLFRIPTQAIFLAVAAFALGWPVLRYELFNPLRRAHAELAQTNKDLIELSALKSRFLANVSHDLRTPLNSIIGYTELVMNGTYGALNDTQLDRLEKVIRNGRSLLELINDVLDLNRIETGLVRLDRVSVPTDQLLQTVLESIEPLAREKGLSVTPQFQTLPPLYADEGRARQILTNLLSNAVKFTHQGGITVRAVESEGMVRIEVEDTGIGIPADQHANVFVEFHQIDHSSTRQYEGTGLGLTITRRLVELHGGRIWLSSAPGHGTTFYVTLPASPGPAFAQ